MMYQSLENFSLRKINYVKTRTTILKTAANLLKQEDFSDITVDEICQKAQISRGTFFNYFPTKEHIFHYYLRIFTIRIALRMKEWPEGLSFHDKITQIYEWFKEDKQYAKFFNNYINFVLYVGEKSNEMKLIDGEFVYFFNGITEEEYAQYNELTLGKLFEKVCSDASEKGEIVLKDSPEALSSLLIGTLAGAYLSEVVNSEKAHLDTFEKIWYK